MADSHSSPLTDSGIERNPFSVCYVQPGAIPFFFEPEFIDRIRADAPLFFTQAYVESFNSRTELTTWVGCSFLAEKFIRAHYRGQIIGPHGSGKSTLTVSLASLLEQKNIKTISYALHDKTRRLPDEFFELLPPKADAPKAESKDDIRTVLILDGYEQLNAWNRVKLRKLCKSRNYGLLITSHHRKRFAGPVLFRSSPSEDTLRKIVDYLLDDAKILPSDRFIKALSAKHKKNFRNILFELYDWFEK